MIARAIHYSGPRLECSELRTMSYLGFAGGPQRVIVQNRPKGHAKRSIRSEHVNARFRIGSQEKIQRPAFHQADPGGSESHADGDGLAGQSGSERTVGMDCRAGEAAYKSVIPPKNRYDPKQPG